ncbi:MAG: hypothetical protein GOMPHAMPRED_001222 [Gomphillus americanus]|uniref:Uncharacterized protein n=1 Tax=Gomphillus americanus TaxID=1940652 RepID=A0A8H3F5D2_9LECA|nr:MAG: hypothetical protein GOMPHAMPRED_001222 [Gomphillus americanus]
MSWLSNKLENSFALSSVKFDFTMVKVEAPIEFDGLGSRLTTRRKADAEDGSIHRTARKLGALFEQIIPSTPNLITAYGQRVSEIIATPGINPQGLTKDGPFETFVGADATALWAAATSGISSIAMYLLATLLAGDEWDHKASISLWVELVAERKREILEGFEKNGLTLESTLMASRQDITRKELALWDASARAWLQSANQAKAKERDQFLLIAKNVHLSNPEGATTYRQVLRLWHDAMKTMEELLNGRPQLIVDRSIPSAIVSWHLFPNLLVLDKEISNICFQDKLIPRSATCTIGAATSISMEEQSLSRWSLALSHYQFYGDKVQVDSEEMFSRVNISQFLIITLGAIFGSWQVRRKDYDAAAQFLVSLWAVIRKTSLPSTTGADGLGLEWLQCLVAGANYFLDGGGLNNRSVTQLLEFGSRRGRSLIGAKEVSLFPYFGLLNPSVFRSLHQPMDIDCGITFFREIAKSMKLTDDVAIIMVDHHPNLEPPNIGLIEFASIGKIGHNNKKRLINGSPANTTSYCRCIKQTPLRARRGIMFRGPDDISIELSSRIDSIEDLGEIVFKETEENSFIDLVKSFWFGYLKLEANPNASSDSLRRTMPLFETVVGSRFFGLFAPRERRDYQARDLATSVNSVPLQTLGLDTLAPGRLYDYLSCIGTKDDRPQFAATGVFQMADIYRMAFSCVESLTAINAARHVYVDLYGATISLSVLNSANSISEVGWRPKLDTKLEFAVSPTQDNSRPLQNSPEASLLRPVCLDLLTRQQALACLAYFEYGRDTLDIDSLDHALAMSIGNSIYVVKRLLSDPFERIPSNRLQRLTGNIGRSGISILIAPIEPRIRELSCSYNLVEHKRYDLRRENNFKSTSLHLSFTQWTCPLENCQSRTQDQDAHFVESVISVRDRGEWVADLDVLSINFENLVRLGSPPCAMANHKKMTFDYISLDTWEELLDFPVANVSVFRANGNWAARLAAVSILAQKDLAHALGIFGPDEFCLDCLENRFPVSRSGFDESESGLPSFCID